MKILFTVVAIFLLVGCGSEDKKTSVQDVQTQKLVEVEKSEPVKVVEKEFVVTESVKAVEVKKEVLVAEPIKVVEVKKEVVVPELVKVVEAKKEVVVLKPIKVAEVKKEVVQSSSIKGKSLYAKCIACHGSSGEKAALNKSKIIKGWDAQKINDALVGYKDGTYGGVMKGLMKSQIAKLSVEDIKILSEYISKF